MYKWKIYTKYSFIIRGQCFATWRQHPYELSTSLVGGMSFSQQEKISMKSAICWCQLSVRVHHMPRWVALLKPFVSGFTVHSLVPHSRGLNGWTKWQFTSLMSISSRWLVPHWGPFRMCFYCLCNVETAWLNLEAILRLCNKLWMY